MCGKLMKLVDEMVYHDVLEDRREYAPEDFKSSYKLTNQESDDLFWLVQEQFAEKRVMTRLEDLLGNRGKADQFIGACLDALHSNLDGWDSEHDRITIERFLSEVLKQ